ncbi:MAG: DUF2203 domain-containing protein [Ignavibacteria bacterium]
MIHNQHFSLGEAEKLLDEMRPLIEEMVSIKQKLNEIGYDVYRHQYFGGTGPNGTGAFPPEMEMLVDVIKKISSKGILIKDIDSGLIDFPHIRKNGEEVYLCWKTGEDKINFWHRIPDGFAGRKNIEEL